MVKISAILVEKIARKVHEKQCNTTTSGQCINVIQPLLVVSHLQQLIKL